MYIHDCPNSDILQDFVSFLSIDKKETNKMNIDVHPSDDPVTNRVFEIALKLLESCDEITVKGVVQASKFSDSPVRKRIAWLVDTGKLGIRLGSGREPSYYFLPNIKSAGMEPVRVDIDDIPDNLVDITDDSANHLDDSVKARITLESIDLLLENIQINENHLKELITKKEDEIKDSQILIAQVENKLKDIAVLKQSVTKTYEVLNDFFYEGEYDT